MKEMIQEKRLTDELRAHPARSADQENRETDTQEQRWKQFCATRLLLHQFNRELRDGMRNRSRQGAKPKEYWMYFKVERHSMGRFIARNSFKMKLVEQ